MPRPRKQAAARSRLMPLLLAHLRARGVNVDRLLTRLRLPDDAERREDVSITPGEFEVLLALASDELSDPLLALTCPSALQPRALHKGVYAPPSVQIEQDQSELIIRLPVHSVPTGRFSDAFYLASALLHARRICGEDLSPRRVWFAHPRPNDTQVAGLQRFFSTSNLDFDHTDNGMAFALSQATAELLAEQATNELPQAPDVRVLVLQELRRAAGPISAASLARRLHLSPRTLLRRLEGEGTTLSALEEEIQRDSDDTPPC